LEWDNTYPITIQPRIANADNPFSKLDVRKAMMMATDKESIAEAYYGGHASVDNFPAPDVAFWASVYTPLEEQPAEIQEIYTYNVDGAKALLTDAGYPSGFDITIICRQSDVDLMTIVQAQWAKVGVTLHIDARENSVWSTIGSGKTFDELYCIEWESGPEIKVCSYTMPGDVRDYTGWNDPTMNDLADAVRGAYYPDETEQQRVIREEMLPYRAANVPWITLPTPYQFTFWQPWIKGYNGEDNLGYCASRNSWPKYVWLDQALKKSMGK